MELSLVLQILSWLAEEERKNIKQRQREGIESAKLRNVKFGRPKIELNEQFKNAYQRWINGEITAVKAMKECDMKKSTFYRKVREFQEQE